MRKKALLGAMLLLVGACAPTGTSPTTVPTTTSAPVTTIPDSTTIIAETGFPVTVSGDNGQVTIDSRPERIVSLSAVATETLFAIGAGSQVVAVDEQSNYPPEAPITDLSGFTPNLEAILSYQPDLVVIAYDPGELISGLEAVGARVLHLDAPPGLEGVYTQIETLGAATGNLGRAAELVSSLQAEIAALVAEVGERGTGITFFHEIDATLYTVTSDTLFGEVYGMFGLVNIADAAGDGGYVQLSSEYVVAADPDLIFLADADYGESPDTVAARPGWGDLTAVRQRGVVELDADLASRWGPRIVEFARAIADAVIGHTGG
jgi:iron complex transport system substrate-binding protein